MEYLDSKESEQAFMAAADRLLEREDYAAFLDIFGADTSRSHDFKAAAFENFTPTDRDIIISTYPKSGTTWTMQIVYQLGFLGDGEFDEIDAVVPWPDKLIPIDNNPTLTDLSHLSASPTGIHAIKSHLEADYMPFEGDGKFITVIRNPKDALVSIEKFENGFNALLFDGKTCPLDAFAEAFMTDTFIYQQWPAFIDSWWRRRDQENVLVLLYEDMKGDGAGTVDRIADFIGVELTTDQRDKVVEKSSFSWMKANTDKFDPPAWDEGKVQLVRSGKAGSAKTGLSPEQRAPIDAWCTAQFSALGSDFPYDRYHE